MIPYLVFASSKDIGTDLPEHLLITDTISTKISCTGSYIYASPLVKSLYQKKISQTKHTLRVLKRTVSMRRFF